MWVRARCEHAHRREPARQFLYGQRYFERAFGVRCRVCWLPDSFGFSRRCRNSAPGQASTVFHHQGQLVGDQPLPARSLLVGRARRRPRARPHVRQPDRRLQRRSAAGLNRADLGAIFAPRRAIRNAAVGRLRRRRRRPDAGIDRGRGRAARFSRPTLRAAGRGVDDFFAARTRPPRRRRCRPGAAKSISNCIADADDAERRQVTPPARRERARRGGDRRLARSSLGRAGAAQPGARVAKAVKNEFHDILPGSSIREVYEDAEAELDFVVAAGLAEQQRSLAAIAARLPPGDIGDALVVVNPSLSTRPLRVMLEDGGTIASADSIPPARRARLRPRRARAAARSRSRLAASENAFLRVEFGDGRLDRQPHPQTQWARSARRTRQPALGLPAGQAGDRDAWDLEEDYAERGEELRQLEKFVIAEKLGPSRPPARHAPLAPFAHRPSVRALRQRPRDIATWIDWAIGARCCTR